MKDIKLNQEEKLVNSSTDNTTETIRKKWYKCRKCALSFTSTCDEHDVGFKYLYKCVVLNVIFLFAILCLTIALIITTTNSSQEYTHCTRNIMTAEPMCELCPNIVYNITDNICCLRGQYIKSQNDYRESEKGVWKNRTS